MSGELAFEYVVTVIVAALVVYGFWSWRRGRVTRRSTRAAIIFGTIVLFADVATDVLADYPMPENFGVMAAIVTVVSVLLSFSGVVALIGAVVSLIIRALHKPRIEGTLASQPVHPQPPSV